MDGKCIVCGTEFIKSKYAANKRYCSSECSSQYKERGRFIILNRDEFRCIYCGTSSIEDDTQLHADHIIPVIDGGTDTAGNLVTACFKCNLSKNSKILSEAIKERIITKVKQRNIKAGISSKQIIRLK